MGIIEGIRGRKARRAYSYLTEHKPGFDVMHVRHGGAKYYPLYMAAMPKDSNNDMIFPDDVVAYRSNRYRVVAMSHRQKVALRSVGDASGRHGFWVSSPRVTLEVAR